MKLQSFGEMIRTARRIKEIPLAGVAAELGLSISHVSYVERGLKNPPDEGLMRRWLKLLGHEDELPKYLKAAERSAYRLSIFTGDKDPRATNAFVTVAKRYDANALTEAELKMLEKLAGTIAEAQ